MFLYSGVVAAGKDVLNVVPTTAEAAIDIRFSPHTDPHDIVAMFDLWCRECSKPSSSARNKVTFDRNLNGDDRSGVQWEILNNASRSHATTSIESAKNPWWGLLTNNLRKHTKPHNADEVAINAEIFPAATDSRFLRALGLRAFGFSPMRNSEIMLHEHNEYISETVFLEGCDIYVTLIEELANTTSFA